MPTLTFSSEDMKRGQIVDPGWWTAKTTNIEEAAAKTDGSTNINVELEITRGPFAGVKVYRTFNEKAPGFAKRYVQALGAKLDPVQGGTVELSNALGKELMIFITNEPYNGVMQNRVNDFRPLDSSAVA